MARQTSLPFAASKFSSNIQSAKRTYDDAINVSDEDDAAMIDLTKDKEEEEDVPVFYIEDDDDMDEGMDEDDAIRELEPDEVDALGPLFDHLSISNIPAGYLRKDAVLSPLGFKIRPRSCVELDSGDFLRVVDVLRHSSGDTVLRGILLRRTRRVLGYLKRDRNELCAMITTQNESVADPPIESSLVLHPLNAAVQLRDLVVTNRPFPELSFRYCGKPYYKGQEQLIEDTAQLVCRWKMVEYVQGSKVVSGALLALRESEADAEGQGLSDAGKRNVWRGNGPGHSGERPNKKNRNEVAIDLTDEPKADPAAHSLDVGLVCAVTEDSQPAREPYIYGDICAGAGGMARGAVQAGLHAKWLLDHWKVACKTLRLNFPFAKVLEKDIFDFCTGNGGRDYRVSVLHCSFPCQTYSPAHTIDGKNDHENEAAGYSMVPILDKTKPRIVTLEQTFGLLRRHYASFAALVHQLTFKGYSVRWRIFNCAQHENAQPRKRLFMIASCPGEPLPPFPKPTHGPGLKPFVTIRERLSLLPRRRAQPAWMQLFTRRVGAPFSPHRQLRNAITTDGGSDSLHYSGQRTWNMQELALLGGFPPEHRFAEAGITDLRRQIGNAVPSMVAKQIFDEVIKSLRKEDGILEEPAPRQQQQRERREQSQPRSSIHVIDDSDEEDYTSAEDGTSESTAWIIDE